MTNDASTDKIYHTEAPRGRFLPTPVHFMPRGLTILPHFGVNFFIVQPAFGCGTVMDRVYEFPGPSRPSTASRNRANLGKIENRGLLEFSHHPFESAAPTSDDHNFPVQTSICLFLESLERFLSLEFNMMK